MQLSSNHYLKKKKIVIDDNISVSLLTEKHKIKPFDCGDEQLNEFLLQEALPYKKELLATTFIIENNERTLGYYSLLNDSFRVEETFFVSKNQYRKFLRELIPYPKRYLRAIPAIKIGRLAIDKTYKGKGLGSLIIHNIINDCLELNERQACRLITIDAYKQSVSFYEKLGFISFTEKDKDENIRQMFLDLSKIQN